MKTLVNKGKIKYNWYISYRTRLIISHLRGNKMRKKIVISGLIVLIIGIVIVGSSTAVVLSNTSVGGKLVQSNSGEWESPVINVSSGYRIVVTSHVSEFAIIPSKDMSIVNATNVNEYSVSSFKLTNVSSTSISQYKPTSGNYYLVVFTTSSPNVKYTVIKSLSQDARLGLIELAGIDLTIAGFVVLIIGLVKKKKN